MFISVSLSAIKSPEGNPFREVRTSQGADEYFLKREVLVLLPDKEKSQGGWKLRKSHWTSWYWIISYFSSIWFE